MAKEKVKHLSGVFASVFAHAGHISKEDAKEISGLKDHEFEKAYEKASSIAESVMQHEGEKMDKFLSQPTTPNRKTEPHDKKNVPDQRHDVHLARGDVT
jgi:hypothetical protein